MISTLLLLRIEYAELRHKLDLGIKLSSEEQRRIERLTTLLHIVQTEEPEQ